MRTVTLVLLVAVLALPMASAETYRISGQATYSDNTPVMLRDVYVECRPGNVDCYQYRGASAITDAQGVFLIAIDVDEDEDGTEIYLQLRGENFTHVIDLDTFRNTSEGKMTQNLRLSQDSSGSGFFSGLGCCLVLFGLVFMSTLLRTVSGLATPRGRAAFQGYREPERHDCPVCNESVAQHNLVKHLIFEHDYDPMDAGEAAGLVMRKSWSNDENDESSCVDENPLQTHVILKCMRCEDLHWILQETETNCCIIQDVQHYHQSRKIQHEPTKIGFH